jgi:hypothetical protein
MVSVDFSTALSLGHVWPALLVVGIPLAAAAITEWRLEAGEGPIRLREIVACGR